MESPIFTLQQVVKSKGEMQDFVGPLALILQLLSKNKIEIKDISVSLILEQYMVYLDSLSKMDLEVASEFVAMASYLVYIKTKMLLSGEKEVDELNELISTLEELQRQESYGRIKTVIDLLGEFYRSNAGLLTKPPEYIAPDNGYRYEHNAVDLLQAFCQVMGREELSELNAAKPVMYPKRITYSVTDKASEILGRLKSHGTLQIKELISLAQSRSEMVAVFVAVLELCKSGNIYLIGYEEELTLCCSGTDGAEIEEISE